MKRRIEDREEKEKNMIMCYYKNKERSGRFNASEEKMKKVLFDRKKKDEKKTQGKGRKSQLR